MLEYDTFQDAQNPQTFMVGGEQPHLDSHTTDPFSSVQTPLSFAPSNRPGMMPSDISAFDPDAAFSGLETLPQSSSGLLVTQEPFSFKIDLAHRFVDDVTGLRESDALVTAQEDVILNQAVTHALDRLENFAEGDDFETQLRAVFGEQFQFEVAQGLVEDILETEGSTLEIVSLPDADMGGANGAYAAATDTLYLAQDFIAENAEHPDAIADVVLEELGHYIDDQINVVDSPGDEGAILAGLLDPNQPLTIAELARLRQENDQSMITVGQQLTSVEQSDNRSTYEVQGGDTLWAIAERELGAGTRWTELQKEDGTLFTEADAAQLQIGDLVYIPGEEPATTTPDVYTYTIAEGDTLWGVAERELGAGARWTELQKADGTSFTEAEAAQLQVGDLIYIPGEASGPEPEPEPEPEPPAEEAPSSPTIPSDFQAYTLTEGDTLWGIAERSLGDGNRWTEFLKEDGTTFTEAEATSLQPGQVIYVPDAPADEPTEPPTAPRSDIERGTYVPPVDQAFLDKVDAIATRLGATPEYLIAVMGFETAGTYDPSIENFGGSGATGLIQFVPETAIGLGTTTSELAEMTALEQLDYVEKYLQSYEGRLNTLEDTYMAVLWPAGIGQDPDQAIMTQGDPYYAGNSGLDINDDGAITPREAADKVRDFLPSANLFGDGEADSPAPPVGSEPNYVELVPIPDKDGISPELTTPNEDFLLATIGNPNIGSSSFEYQNLIETRDVGPFTVTGLRPMLEDLQAIFAQVKAERPALYESVQEIGLFVRRPKKDSSGNERSGTISSHSWGTAIDLYFGEAFDLAEDGQTNRGLVELAPYFDEKGYVWGARFSNFEDPGHFEASRELIQQWQANGWSSVDLPAGEGGSSPTPPTSPAAYPGYVFNYEPGQSIGYDANVERWQQQMQDLGWEIAVDGKYGPQSQGVARDFQELYPALENDGIVGPQTWATSFGSEAKGPAAPPPAPPAPATPPTPEPSEDGPLEIGDRGPQVQLLQEKLLDLGYELPLGDADGVFGEETAAAVQNFHRDRGLGFDKSVDTQTWAAFEWNHLKNPEQSTYPDDALSTATDLTLENGGVNVADRLGYQRSRYEFDQQDVYKFRLTQSGDIDLYIGGSELKSDLQLKLLDSSGDSIQFADTLNDNRIRTNLAAGEYYIEITASGSGRTPYRLNLTSTAPGVPPSSQPLAPNNPDPLPVPAEPQPPLPQPTFQEVDFELDFETIDQSIWNSGEALADLDETYFLGAEWDEEGSAGPLSGSTSGKVGLEAKLAVNSGTIDASLPVDFQFSIPENIRPGQTITIASDFEIDEAAFFETVGPKVDAALDLILDTKTNLKAGAFGKNIHLLDDVSIGGNINILEFGQQEDEEKEDETDEEEKTKSQKILGAGSLELKAPEISTKGNFDQNLAVASDQGEFLTASLDLDKLASIFIPNLPPLGVDDLEVGPVEVGYNILDVKLIGQLLLKQEFALSLEEMAGQLTLENGDVIDFNVGEDITYTVPEDFDFGHSLDIEASFEPETELTNETNLAYGIDVDLEALSATGKFKGPWLVPDLNLDIGPVFEKTFTPFEGDLFSIYEDTFALKGWGTETKSFEIAIA